MPEREALDRLMNPHNFKHPYLMGEAAGGAALAVGGFVISAWHHRSMHGGVEYIEPVKKAFRATANVTTGMAKFDWVDHLVHHPFSGRYDEEAHNAWNENRPEGAPEAPAEVFRGPYEPELEGYWKVMLGTPFLHRKSYKPIQSFLYSLDAHDKNKGLETRDHWPEHLRRVDMEEGDPKKFRTKHKALGMAALWTTVGLFAGPKVALPGAATHIAGIATIAGMINAAPAHTGQEKGFWNRAKVLFGIKKPVPNEKGETAANVLEGNEGISMGEFRHEAHHDEPENPFLAGDTLRRDPPGKFIKFARDVGWAATPGSPERRGPPSKVAKLVVKVGLGSTALEERQAA